MRLYLDFEPCHECVKIMNALASPEILFADTETRASESAKFLRHLTYNHPEAVQAVSDELPKQKKSQEFDFFK